jgi:hypothetical protein
MHYLSLSKREVLSLMLPRKATQGFCTPRTPQTKRLSKERRNYQAHPSKMMGQTNLVLWKIFLVKWCPLYRLLWTLLHCMINDQFRHSSHQQNIWSLLKWTQSCVKEWQTNQKQRGWCSQRKCKVQNVQDVWWEMHGISPIFFQNQTWFDSHQGMLDLRG